jgi:hypothetical protein
MGRDYPFHKYAILSYPKYTLVDNHKIPYVEVLGKKLKDYVFFNISEKSKKPDVSSPVFIMTVKTGMQIATLNTLPNCTYLAQYNPKFNNQIPNLVFAAFAVAKDLELTHVIVEDNVYLKNPDINYSDYVFLKTGRPWYKFLPLSSELLKTNQEKLLYKQWSVLANEIKHTGAIDIAINLKGINPYHIGSAFRVIKRILKTQTAAYKARFIPIFFAALNLQSFYGEKYTLDLNNLYINSTETHHHQCSCH